MHASVCRSVGIWAATPAGYTRIKQNADLADTAFLDYWWIDASGNLINHDPGWFDPSTHPAPPLQALGVTCYGALASGNAATILSAITTNKAAFIRNLTSTCQSLGLDGIHLDIEFSPQGDPTRRTKYAAFVTQLAAALHANGKKLSVYSFAFQSDAAMNASVFDWDSFGAAADRVEVGSYDEFWDPVRNPGGPNKPYPIQTPAWVGYIMDYISTKPYWAKFYPGIAAYGFRWTNGVFDGVLCSYAQVKAAVAAYGGAPVWNAGYSAYSYSYSAAGNNYVYWYGEQDSAAAVAAMLVSKNAPGAFVFIAGGEDADPNGTTNGTWDKLRAAFCSAASPTPSASPTASGTLTRSPTRSLTPSATGTPTASPSGTPSGTPSKSPTGTASLTPSPSGTRSVTPTRTSTATATPSPSATGSGTPTPSVTATRTATQSPSVSPTAPGTFTQSPSVTSTPSRTPTATPSPTATATPTRSASPTATATFTATPTRSASPTGTATFTATPTRSASATPSQTLSMTLTWTASPTRSASPTATATPTPSASLTPTATMTASLTATESATLTLSPTASASFTASPSPSATPSMTATGTSSPSASPSALATSAPSLTPSPSATPSPAASPSPSPLAVAGLPPADPGENQVLKLLPDRNPNPKLLRVLMAGQADAIRVECFGKSMALLRRGVGPGCPGPGWASVDLQEALAGLPNGFYYMRVYGERGGRPGGKPRIVIVALLR